MSLTEKEYKFLKLVYNNPRNGRYVMRKLRIDDKEFTNLVNVRLRGYAVSYMNSDTSKVVTHITPEGKAAAEKWNKDNRRYRMSLIFSFAAVAISLTALVVSIISLCR